MGRHTESGSDGLDWGSAPPVPGRRRTDAPDRLWSGAAVESLSEHPTAPGRPRTERAAGGLRTPDNPRQLSRSRLPLPPVPVAPRTTAAPFRAVPAPERGFGAPARMTPSRPWASDDAALAAIAVPPVGRGSALGIRTGLAAPESPAYGDWTRPSRAGETDAGSMGDATDSMGPAAGSMASAAGSMGPAVDSMGSAADDDYRSGPIGPRVHAPATSLIPDRTVAPRRERAEQQYPPEHYGEEYEAGYDAGYEAGPLEVDEPAPSRGPATGPAVGGRASKRAERQAIELVRQQAAKRNGVSSVAVLDDDATPGGKRRVVRGLFAMVVLALLVLGAYSLVSPHTKVAASRSSSTAGVDAASAAAAAASDTAALPPLTTTAPVAAAPVDAAPVRLPITVLNATTVNGLAAKAAKAFTAKGWQAPSVGAYKGGDIASSTVYFAQGDEKQRQAAVQLVNQFPQLTGPAPRFFQLPAGVSAPGLVVVLTGDWRP